jgi:hypothetical protein
MSTAVWMVMCSEPVTRTPFSGLPGAYFLRIDIKPGISNSAMEISLRPQFGQAHVRHFVLGGDVVDGCCAHSISVRKLYLPI